MRQDRPLFVRDHLGKITPSEGDRHVFVGLVMLLGSGLALAAEGKPLTPAEARKQAGPCSFCSPAVSRCIAVR